MIASAVEPKPVCRRRSLTAVADAETVGGVSQRKLCARDPPWRPDVRHLP